MVNVAFQVDMYDEGIAEAYVIARKLKNHKTKLYKKCGMRKCNKEVLNKPNRHYCWECMMINFQNNQVLDEYLINVLCK